MKRKYVARKSVHLGSIESEMLEELSISDLLVGFLLSGRSTRAMFNTAKERAKHRYNRKLAFERLLKRGLINKHGEDVSISSSGMHMVDASIRKARDSLAQQWDHKWRIVSYDIPEIYKDLRDMVRSILKRAGFVMVHHSLWIFPQDCEELIVLMRQETKLGKYIVYAVAEKIENEKELRKRFKL